MAPDFGEMLLAVPEAARRGRVFRLDPLPGTRATLDANMTSMNICDIGEAANVVVERSTRKGKPYIKYASAHDCRRAFGLRWSKLVMPPTLMQLMRHQDIKTTMQYCVGKNVQDAADQLRAAFESQAEKSNISVTSGDFADSGEEAEVDETSSFPSYSEFSGE